ncbi:type II toxin-antitoxin system toxin DNA ADP-ribosyl transferase DarT [Xanthobacter wiegelii]|uniref:type II toxin-antitoxin system toxin DNA ADP-ribosyl transferase DarT n=1 Tax=Xanthobacter wiegelii TaxID=3119913 RepID=UPI003729908C
MAKSTSGAFSRGRFRPLALLTMPVPAHPKIYHIVHVDNLPSIVTDGSLWPDVVMAQRQGMAVIGNNEIKADRLSLPVSCHLGTRVGEYVPFYFCPRSVMLYVIHKKNHPNVAYREGQGPVVHLMADLHEAIEWAAHARRKWAFTDINAANRAADFYDDVGHLGELDWSAIGARQWPSCRDHKMAEFLMHQGFPWELVREIGVHSENVGRRAMAAFGEALHRPPIKVKPEWYY